VALGDGLEDVAPGEGEAVPDGDADPDGEGRTTGGAGE
jgi:hypothetical protein